MIGLREVGWRTVVSLCYLQVSAMLYLYIPHQPKKPPSLAIFLNTHATEKPSPHRILYKKAIWMGHRAVTADYFNCRGCVSSIGFSLQAILGAKSFPPKGPASCQVHTKTCTGFTAPHFKTEPASTGTENHF